MTSRLPCNLVTFRWAMPLTSRPWTSATMCFSRKAHRHRVLPYCTMLGTMSTAASLLGTESGLTPKKRKPKKLTAKGLTVNGLTHKGLTPKELKPKGLAFLVRGVHIWFAWGLSARKSLKCCGVSSRHGPLFTPHPFSHHTPFHLYFNFFAPTFPVLFGILGCQVPPQKPHKKTEKKKVLLY